VARVGVSTQRDSTGERVMQTATGGAAAQAGVQPGDYLVSVAGIATTDPNWAAQFRAQYNGREGADMPIVVRRGGQDVTLSSKVMLATVVNQRIDFDPAASARAVRIRDGIMKGR
jgi:C-terminal processing protease CtpA/Prc